MCTNVFFPVESFDPAPDADILAFFPDSRLSVDRFSIDPLFYIDEASAVVKSVSYICSLGCDGVDLANEGYLPKRIEGQ